MRLVVTLAAAVVLASIAPGQKPVPGGKNSSTNRRNQRVADARSA